MQNENISVIPKMTINQLDAIAMYAFYKKTSSRGLYIAFVIDQMPFHPRRSSAISQWEIVCKRRLTSIEKEEVVNGVNSGDFIQRFIVWYYKNIEELIADDALYNLSTPDEFIKECKKRGYTN